MWRLEYAMVYEVNHERGVILSCKIRGPCKGGMTFLNLLCWIAVKHPGDLLASRFIWKRTAVILR
jgi:hypothetical protein